MKNYEIIDADDLFLLCTITLIKLPSDEEIEKFAFEQYHSFEDSPFNLKQNGMWNSSMVN